MLCSGLEQAAAHPETQQLPGQQPGAPLFGAGCEVRRFPRTVKQRGEALLGGDGSWGKEKPPHEGQGAVSQLLPPVT